MKFERVSLKQWIEACAKCDISEDYAIQVYNNIELPKRATIGSAGYDFINPFKRLHISNKQLLIPTGIRWTGNDINQVLLMCPRSGQGFNYGATLRNTIGVIDSDYQFATNEGHIMAKMSAEEEFFVEQGQAFVQGIILNFCTVDEEQINCIVRKGGFGSTDLK